MVLSRLPSNRTSSAASAVRVLLLLLTTAALAGCATSQARTYDPPTRVSASARYEGPPNGAPAVEMEDDGLPVQPPPVARRDREPDDPTEPYSPNYGRADAHPDAPLPEADDEQAADAGGPSHGSAAANRTMTETRMTRGVLAAYR